MLVIVATSPTIAAENSDVLPMSFVAIAVMHAPAATGGIATKATSLREKMIKVGAKVVAHGRYLVFQMAEVAVPRELFRRLLNRIAALRPPALARC